jgi:hypothetical protein
MITIDGCLIGAFGGPFGPAIRRGDDLLPNLKLLDARLSAEYFEVLTRRTAPMP